MQLQRRRGRARGRDEVLNDVRDGGGSWRVGGGWFTLLRHDTWGAPPDVCVSTTGATGATGAATTGAWTSAIFVTAPTTGFFFRMIMIAHDTPATTPTTASAATIFRRRLRVDGDNPPGRTGAAAWGDDFFPAVVLTDR